MPGFSATFRAIGAFKDARKEADRFTYAPKTHVEKERRMAVQRPYRQRGGLYPAMRGTGDQTAATLVVL